LLTFSKSSASGFNLGIGHINRRMARCANSKCICADESKASKSFMVASRMVPSLLKTITSAHLMQTEISPSFGGWASESWKHVARSIMFPQVGHFSSLVTWVIIKQKRGPYSEEAASTTGTTGTTQAQ
jgi:hypothetical protein